MPVPDLRQLRTFVAVAEESSFTRAAERLYMGQQAVSKAIRQLERELGVELLERTTHHVRLTEAGATLLDSGREVLAAADVAFQRTREVGRGLSGTVTVGVSPAVAPAERVEVAQALRAGAGRLSVSMLEIRPSDIRRSLRNSMVDLVLARTSGALAGVQSASLRPTQAILCVPETHPLATTPLVRLAQLDGARLLTWNPPGSPLTDLILTELAAAGCAVTCVQARVTGAPLAELADLEAVALMPAGWPQLDGIAQIPLAEKVELPLLVLWRAGVHSPAVERVRARLRAP